LTCFNGSARPSPYPAHRRQTELRPTYDDRPTLLLLLLLLLPPVLLLLVALLLRRSSCADAPLVATSASRPHGLLRACCCAGAGSGAACAAAAAVAVLLHLHVGGIAVVVVVATLQQRGAAAAARHRQRAAVGALGGSGVVTGLLPRARQAVPPAGAAQRSARWKAHRETRRVAAAARRAWARPYRLGSAWLGSARLGSLGSAAAVAAVLPSHGYRVAAQPWERARRL
jgi:hypothetical protein